ncbi:unnamed protein product [marine sediment metagenome]|uniref:PD(D/E)XK endonuclease domain-containing protein n=1 Tax=marine sediment metagenome TaxID=412755 RepID=X0TVC2_9ZZZZ
MSTSVSDYEAHHAEMMAAVEHSWPSVQYVAQWLVWLGHRVTVGDHTLAPTRSERRKHSDKGDLHVWFRGEPDVYRRVEVKHREKKWPWLGLPPDTIMCGSSNKWDEADPKPYMMILLHPKMTEVYHIGGAWREKCWVEDRWDDTAKAMQQTLITDAKNFTYKKIEMPDVKG